MQNFSIMNWINGPQDYIVALSAHNPLEMMVILFFDGFWVLFAVVLVWGFFHIYMNYINNKYAMSVEWTLLAIDIPQENLQTIKAVEHIFAGMWPFYESKTKYEKYVEGKFQLAYSLEIVSIGGYTQFLIRVPVTHKDIVESAIYAQYPKAEIYEVEDYTKRYKDLTFPNDKYDLWGSEFGLKRPSPFPIRTYPYFEHGLTQLFADPMASLLEVFNNIQKNEELWMQIVITPIADEWKEGGHKIINKMIGASQTAKGNWLEHVLYPFYYLGTLLQELLIYGIGYEPGKEEVSVKAADNQPPNKMLYLTPEEKNMIEGITSKITKLGYQTKMRAIYLGSKGKLNKAKGVAAFIGALQQFSTLDLNAFKPIMKTFTKANYLFVDRRLALKKNKILRNFKSRSQSAGGGRGFILNIEELASIYHLPSPEAVRESVKIVEAKKEVPPINLPDTFYEEEEILRNIERQDEADRLADDQRSSSEDRSTPGATKAPPPSNLPV